MSLSKDSFLCIFLVVILLIALGYMTKLLQGNIFIFLLSILLGIFAAQSIDAATSGNGLVEKELVFIICVVIVPMLYVFCLAKRFIKHSIQNKKREKLHKEIENKEKLLLQKERQFCKIKQVVHLVDLLEKCDTKANFCILEEISTIGKLDGERRILKKEIERLQKQYLKF